MLLFSIYIFIHYNLFEYIFYHIHDWIFFVLLINIWSRKIKVNRTVKTKIVFFFHLHSRCTNEVPGSAQVVPCASSLVSYNLPSPLLSVLLISRNKNA